MPFKHAEARKAYDFEYRNRPDVKERRRAQVRAWSLSNPDRIAMNGARRRKERRAKCLIAAARVRARKRDLLFDLDQHIDDLQARVDVGLCELSGTLFDLSPGRTFASPSLHRINPGKGYTHGNILVICHAMNVALGDWGEDALRRVMEGWQATRSARRSPPSSSGW